MDVASRRSGASGQYGRPFEGKPGDGRMVRRGVLAPLHRKGPPEAVQHTLHLIRDPGAEPNTLGGGDFISQAGKTCGSGKPCLRMLTL